MKSKKIGNFLVLTGLLLIAAALAITLWNITESKSAGDSAQSILGQLREQSAQASTPGVEALPEYMLDPNREMPTMETDGQEYIGIVQIPSLELSLPVMSTWSYPQLKLAPCRFMGSTYRNDLIIMAHNFDTHFGGLIKLAIDDPVVFVDAEGTSFRYRVVEMETLDGMAIEEMVAGEWDLTLFTCTKGGAARVTVRCLRENG